MESSENGKTGLLREESSKREEDKKARSLCGSVIQS